MEISRNRFLYDSCVYFLMIALCSAVKLPFSSFCSSQTQVAYLHCVKVIFNRGLLDSISHVACSCLLLSSLIKLILICPENLPQHCPCEFLFFLALYYTVSCRVVDGAQAVKAQGKSVFQGIVKSVFVLLTFYFNFQEA